MKQWRYPEVKFPKVTWLMNSRFKARLADLTQKTVLNLQKEWKRQEHFPNEHFLRALVDVLPGSQPLQHL